MRRIIGAIAGAAGFLLLVGCTHVPLLIAGMDAEDIQRVSNDDLCRSSDTFLQTRGRRFPNIENEIDRRGLPCGDNETQVAEQETPVDSATTPVAAPPADTASRALQDVNMRAGPGTGHAVVGLLRAGETVTVLRVDGTWCECSSPRQARFFVSCRYLSPTRGGFEAWAPAARIAGIWPGSTSRRSVGDPGTSFSSDIVFARGDELFGGNCMFGSDAWACMQATMQRLGASPTALAFARHLESLGSPGWASEFQEMGQVDLVGTTYPLRANTNGALLMVNGSPNIVEVESFELSAEDRRLPAWRNLIRRHPDAFLTVRAGLVRHERTRSGGQRFIFSDVVAVCRACDPLAEAEFAYEFASDGRLRGTRLLRVVPPGSGSASSQSLTTASSTSAPRAGTTQVQGNSPIQLTPIRRSVEGVGCGLYLDRDRQVLVGEAGGEAVSTRWTIGMNGSVYYFNTTDFGRSGENLRSIDGSISISIDRQSIIRESSDVNHPFRFSNVAVTVSMNGASYIVRGYQFCGADLDYE